MYNKPRANTVCVVEEKKISVVEGKKINNLLANKKIINAGIFVLVKEY